MKNTYLKFVLAAGIALAVSPATANILFWDGFDYGESSDNIQNVSDWDTGSGVLYYDPNGLSHPGLPGETGGSFYHDHDGGNRAINRSISVNPDFENASPGDEWWLAGLIQLENHSGTSRIRLDASGGGSTVNAFGFGVDGSGEVLFTGSANESGNTDHGTGVFAAADGSTYLFVLQGIFGPGNSSDRESTINLWFNPQDTSSVAAMGTPAFTDSLSKWGRDDTIYDNVNVSLSYQSRADEIRFGTSLESVAVPEPGTLALLGGALAGLLYLRRRRR